MKNKFVLRNIHGHSLRCRLGGVCRWETSSFLVEGFETREEAEMNRKALGIRGLTVAEMDAEGKQVGFRNHLGFYSEASAHWQMVGPDGKAYAFLDIEDGQAVRAGNTLRYADEAARFFAEVMELELVKGKIEPIRETGKELVIKPILA